MLYLGNAFSGAMLLQNILPSRGMKEIVVKRFDVEDVINQISNLGFESVVGHADMAGILTKMLGKEVKMNRVSVNLKHGDQLIWAQYNGPRLPEGATSLPEGAEIVFLAIAV